MPGNKERPAATAANRTLRGFTILELMVTVAVIAVLAAIAYPSYTKYVARGKRAAAKSFMLQVASRQERYLLDAHQYAPDLATLGMPVPNDVTGSYTVTLTGVAATPPSYTVQAQPTGTQATNDAGCGTLTITSAGAKGASGSDGSASCWSR